MFKNLPNELWAFLVLLTGVCVLGLTWHNHVGDTIAASIIGAALNKFTSKPDPNPTQVTPEK